MDETLMQANSQIDWNKRVTLADIVAAVEDVREVPQPFNGARHVRLSRDVAVALADVLEPYMRNPLTRATVEFEISDTLPVGYGIGHRPWRKGDDPELEFLGPVMVWLLGPKADDATT